MVLRKRDATFDAGLARRLLLDSGAYDVRVTESGVELLSPFPLEL